MLGHMEDEGGGGGSLRLQAAWGICVWVCMWSTEGSKIASAHSELSNTAVLGSPLM